MFQVEGTACANVLRQDCAWCIGGTVKKPTWLEQSERGGEREEGRARRGQVHRFGSCGGEDLGFYPEGGGSPGRVWAEDRERHLTQVLTGVL